MNGGRRADWIEWTRTELTPEEVREEFRRLSPEEREQLDDVGWLWMPGRLLWLDPGNALRCARFTHGADFRTAKGRFLADSAGGVRRVSDGPEDRASPRRPVRSPSLLDPPPRPRR